MARIVSDKGDHLKRLMDLANRIRKLLSYLDKCEMEFLDVRKADLKVASAAYVRILNKLHMEFDIDDKIQRVLHAEIYHKYLGAVDRNDYERTLQACRNANRESHRSLTAKLASINKEIEDA